MVLTRPLLKDLLSRMRAEGDHTADLDRLRQCYEPYLSYTEKSVPTAGSPTRNLSILPNLLFQGSVGPITIHRNGDATVTITNNMGDTFRVRLWCNFTRPGRG